MPLYRILSQEGSFSDAQRTQKHAGFLVHPMPSVFVSGLIVLDCPAAV
jgi:hypothetical protein